MKGKENEWKYEVIISVLVILLVIGGIKLKSYYDKKAEEAAIQKEKEIAQEWYKFILESTDVYSGTESMYKRNNRIRRELSSFGDVFEVEMINSETGEANIGLMHSTKAGDFYIYDDYLKMLLRAYYFAFGKELAYSYDEIIAMNGLFTEQQRERFYAFVECYPDYKDSYLEKVSKAYDKYFEVNGEKYAGKEKYQLNYEDCLALEEYFEEEPEPEETREVDDEEYLKGLIINSSVDDLDESK